MTARDYLDEVKGLDYLKKILDNEIRKLRQEAYSLGGIDYSRDRVDGGTSRDIYDKVNDLNDRIRKKERQRRLIDELEREADERISSLSNPVSRGLLIDYYILRRNWREIKNDLHESRSTVFRLIDKARKEFGTLHAEWLQSFTHLVDFL